MASSFTDSTSTPRRSSRLHTVRMRDDHVTPLTSRTPERRPTEDTTHLTDSEDEILAEDSEIDAGRFHVNPSFNPL
jgi:hypothetical protein